MQLLIWSFSTPPLVVLGVSSLINACFALSEVTEGLNATMASPFFGRRHQFGAGSAALLMPCSVRGYWSIHCALCKREWDPASQSIHMQKPTHPYFFSTTTPTNASISKIDCEIQVGLNMAKKGTLKSFKVRQNGWEFAFGKSLVKYYPLWNLDPI